MTIEGYQTVDTQFPFGESMLTTPDELLLFSMLSDDLQNDPFHHLSRDRSELIVSWVLLLLKTGVALAFPQSPSTSPIYTNAVS